MVSQNKDEEYASKLLKDPQLRKQYEDEQKDKEEKCQYYYDSIQEKTVCNDKAKETSLKDQENYEADKREIEAMKRESS